MTTLLSLVESLARDPQAKADYAAAPDAFLERNGFGTLNPSDVSEAVLHASAALPPTVAAQLNPEGGLASVAEVDPQTFPDGPGGETAEDYEEDLFGFDDSPPDPGGEIPDTAGIQPHPEPAEEPAEEPDQHGAADGLGPDATAPSISQLLERSDPHDLDDEPGLLTHPAPASAEGSPDGAADPDPFTPTAAPEPVDDGQIDQQDERSPSFETEPDRGELTDADSFTGSDPLAAATSEGWYPDGGDRSFDETGEEPAGDILDDVDDLHLDDN